MMLILCCHELCKFGLIKAPHHRIPFDEMNLLQMVGASLQHQTKFHELSLRTDAVSKRLPYCYSTYIFFA
ncbi:hypothetical protein L1987_28742 [Smallanthus sonchifolius]|uniref:Uncharacterized protein n=1 Tax=Smallanthus sonchifolius TaxID=185202 RepID=A0ACB9HXF9_9ASTR|nr:hypothetical protein L1987_28742 [Smallanthus sonchifolius]